MARCSSPWPALLDSEGKRAPPTHISQIPAFNDHVERSFFLSIEYKRSFCHPSPFLLSLPGAGGAESGEGDSLFWSFLG